LIKCITIANVITGGTGGTGTTGIIGSIFTNPQERYALFDPYVGSVITAVLVTLFALAQGPYDAIGVIAMYIGAPFIEGKTLIPLSRIALNVVYLSSCRWARQPYAQFSLSRHPWTRNRKP
jgi:hypothetical protein